MKLRGNELFKILDRYAGIPLVFLIGLFTPKGIAVPGNPRTITVIKLSALGDTVLLVPALRALKSKFPSARVRAICTNINEVVFKACPYVDDVSVIKLRNLFVAPLAFIRQVRSMKGDVVYDFDQWVRLTPIIAWLSGTPVRVGFKTRGQFRHFSYTRHVDHRSDRHEIESFLDIANLYGTIYTDTTLEFSLSPDDMSNARKVLESVGVAPDDPYLILHPETPVHGGQRQWPLDRYVALGKLINARYKIKVLIAGTGREYEQNRRIAEGIGAAQVLPPVSIPVYAAILSKARALVCGNTGIMHLACAVHAPVVALHGPTDPRKWGPRGKNAIVIQSDLQCSPCLYLGFEYGCSDNRCMQSIKPESVLEKLQTFLLR